jgi:hypothetical protein
MMNERASTGVRVLVGLVIAAAACAATGRTALAGNGYWDLFCATLNPNGLYWNQVNGGTGPAGDPLVSPDPDGNPVFDNASALGGATYAFGGHDWGTGSLEPTVVAGNQLQLSNASAYHLSFTLDTRTLPDRDRNYPSWGTFGSILVEKYDGSTWTPFAPTWTVSPTSPTGGTTHGANWVTVGAGDVNDPESGKQTDAIYGIGATLPSVGAMGYRVTFDTNLRTWDSYSRTGSGGGPGGGQGTPAKPANGLPTLLAVPGKEYSNSDPTLSDTDAAGFADMHQNICFDGFGGAADTFDYTSSGISTIKQVDAIANSLDAYFQEVAADAVPMVVSVANDPSDGDILYQMGQNNVTGTWATASQINAVSPPDDLDGLELWGPDGPGNDDANMFSLDGDPSGVAVWRYDPNAHQSVPYITTAALMSAIGATEVVDLDALMVWDIDGDDTFGGGDAIIFSVENNQGIGGSFDGGEIWIWHFGATAQFLVHGGVVWDTFNPVGLHFNVNTEEINALEAIAVPEPATAGLLVLGAGLMMMPRRRRD